MSFALTSARWSINIGIQIDLSNVMNSSKNYLQWHVRLVVRICLLVSAYSVELKIKIYTLHKILIVRKYSIIINYSFIYKGNLPTLIFNFRILRSKESFLKKFFVIFFSNYMIPFDYSIYLTQIINKARSKPNWQIYKSSLLESTKRTFVKFISRA